MYDDGYTDVISIDISDIVISRMNEYAKNKNKNIVCNKIFFFNFVYLTLFFLKIVWIISKKKLNILTFLFKKMLKWMPQI